MDCFDVATITLSAFTAALSVIACLQLLRRSTPLLCFLSATTFALAVGYVGRVFPLLPFVLVGAFLQQSIIYRFGIYRSNLYGATIMSVANLASILFVFVIDGTFQNGLSVTIMSATTSALVSGVVVSANSNNLLVMIAALPFCVANALLFILQPVCESGTAPCALNIIVLISCALTQIASATSAYFFDTKKPKST
jgi:hypothetical protein